MGLFLQPPVAPSYRIDPEVTHIITLPVYEKNVQFYRNDKDTLFNFLPLNSVEETKSI